MQIKIFHKDDIQDKLKTRALYEENFDIGDIDFVNYYYDTIIKRNEVAVLLDGDKIISMIHLNPYTYNVCGREYNVHYLVAIATKCEYRKKGYMSMLLEGVLNYLKELKEPFCYLVPENKDIEKYYSSFGFASVCPFTVDKFSKKEYDIYPVKSDEYNKLMLAEDKFLSLETDEYRDNLAKKNVMVKILDETCGIDIAVFKNSRVYICQEV